ncbi:hypothetical protein ABK040_012632 [Willaertia magna]
MHKKLFLNQTICTTILLFSHHSDWSLNKPKLISLNFRKAFESVEFAIQYLIYLFKLDEEEANKLDSFTIYDKYSYYGNPRKKMKRQDDVLRKMDYQEILKFYVKQYDIANNRINLIKQNLLNYEMTRDTSILGKTIEMMRLEKINTELNKKSEMTLNDESYFNFDEKEKKFFRGLKGLFVTQHKETKTNSSTKYFIEYIVFTSCGFPFIVQAYFSHHIDSNKGNHELSERFLINSKELFYHELFYSEYGDHNWVTSKATCCEELIEDLTEVFLYKKTCEYYGYKSRYEGMYELNVGTFLYNWLEAGLLDYSLVIMNNAMAKETDFVGSWETWHTIRYED